MSLNPRITKDAQGVYWLEWTPDPTAGGYAFTTPTGASRSFNKTLSKTKLGKHAEPVVATVAALDVSARAAEHASYPAVVEPPPPAPRLSVDAAGKLSWTATAGATDYELAEISPSGAATYRRLGNVLTHTPPAHPGETWQYDVSAVPGGVWYGRVSHAWEGTAPPPPPPVTGSGLLGVIVGAGNNVALAKNLKPKVIREDSINQEKVDWAAANGIVFIGLATRKNTADTISLAKRYPKIRVWELDNEPYFQGAVVAQWAPMVRDTAKALKALDSSYTVLLPMFVQTDGGDYRKPGGGFAPWAFQVLDAAPDLPRYIDGYAGHPYSPGKPPSWVITEKVRAQLIGRQADKPWHFTEWGWSVGTGNEQVSEALQAQYTRDFVVQARTRPWVKTMTHYCLQAFGSSGYEPSFGLFNLSGSERQVVQVFRGLL